MTKNAVTEKTDSDNLAENSFHQMRERIKRFDGAKTFRSGFWKVGIIEVKTTLRTVQVKRFLAPNKRNGCSLR